MNYIYNIGQIRYGMITLFGIVSDCIGYTDIITQMNIRRMMWCICIKILPTSWAFYNVIILFLNRSIRRVIDNLIPITILVIILILFICLSSLTRRKIKIPFPTTTHTYVFFEFVTLTLHAQDNFTTCTIKMYCTHSR